MTDIFKSGAYEYTYTEGGVCILSYLGKDVRKLLVPERLGGKNVVAIRGGAFCYLNRLRELILPIGLREISDDAFFGCRELRKIFFSSGENIKITSGAFSYCEKLYKTNLSSKVLLNAISKGAFFGCHRLQIN